MADTLRVASNLAIPRAGTGVLDSISDMDDDDDVGGGVSSVPGTLANSQQAERNQRGDVAALSTTSRAEDADDDAHEDRSGGGRVGSSAGHGPEYGVTIGDAADLSSAGGDGSGEGQATTTPTDVTTAAAARQTTRQRRGHEDHGDALRADV